MQIQNIDGVVSGSYSYEDFQEEQGVINQIVENTENTWQPGRERQETFGNTEQGKTAEKIVEAFMEQEFGQTLEMKSYDSIRCDNYEKHAPFDFLIWERGKVNIEPIVTAIQNDIRAAAGRYVRISQPTRKLCRENGVKIAEVKSTKVAERHKNIANFNGNYEDNISVKNLINRIIASDDFLCYPAYRRKEIRSDYSIEDYCNEVKARYEWLADYDGTKLVEQIIAHECKIQLCDLFVRVYIDEEASRGFIIGWIQKEDFYSGEVQFKRMSQPNKSEYALYWAKPLRHLKEIQKIDQAVIKDERVYVSKFTTRNFYHKEKSCRFLNGIAEEDMIIFGDEKEAIRDGRYVRRCFNCFH